MKELIERGHVYIAQPPLYKVKRGKQEMYVKDDIELSSYLMTVALDGASLQVTPDAPGISGTALESLTRQYQDVRSIIERLSTRYDAHVLETLVDFEALDKDKIQDNQYLNDWLGRFESAANDPENTALPSYRVVLETPAEGDINVVVTRTRHAVDKVTKISIRFFESSEYAAIINLGAELTGLIEPGSVIHRGEKFKEIESLPEAIDWLMAEARRGQHIQRYKGLGEMNPEQLWDTTVNPETRRLLQVRIEDVIGADDIFNTLMGDQVEPRRDFIESNALAASNIDI
jgi:DNA gyrase subunit B